MRGVCAYLDAIDARDGKTTIPKRVLEYFEPGPGSFIARHGNIFKNSIIWAFPILEKLASRGGADEDSLSAKHDDRLFLATLD